MTSYLYYAIRHKKTQELMPQGTRDKGYSHWNPDNPEHEFKQSSGVPRLIDTRRKAARCIIMWATFPNGYRSVHQSFDGEYDDVVDFKPDGRKKEDLEVIEVSLEVPE